MFSLYLIQRHAVKACREVGDIFTPPPPYPLGKYSQYSWSKGVGEPEIRSGYFKVFHMHDDVTPDLNDQVPWLA